MIDASRHQFSLLPKGTHQFVLRNINFNRSYKITDLCKRVVQMLIIPCLI